eukprot:scaffold107_cov106-Isochrysis_galbana.AAC.3
MWSLNEGITCGLHVARLVASTVTAAAAGSLFVVGAVGGRGGEADGEARSEEQGREEAQSAAPHAARSAAPLLFFIFTGQHAPPGTVIVSDCARVAKLYANEAKSCRLPLPSLSREACFGASRLTPTSSARRKAAHSKGHAGHQRPMRRHTKHEHVEKARSRAVHCISVAAVRAARTSFFAYPPRTGQPGAVAPPPQYASTAVSRTAPTTAIRA